MNSIAKVAFSVHGTRQYFYGTTRYTQQPA